MGNRSTRVSPLRTPVGKADEEFHSVVPTPEVFDKYDKATRALLSEYPKVLEVLSQPLFAGEVEPVQVGFGLADNFETPRQRAFVERNNNPTSAYGKPNYDSDDDGSEPPGPCELGEEPL